MPVLEVTKKDLFKACESLFGSDIDVSVEFLRYLKPAGVKAAYRKKALETHPDRALIVDSKPDFLEKRFKEINLAYQLLQAFLEAPWKYSLDESGSVYERKEPPPKPASKPASRKKAPGPNRKAPSPKMEPLYQGKIPSRRLMLGQYLYYTGQISFSVLIKAIVWQRLQRPSIGAIAASWGWIEGPDILDVLSSRHFGEKFGECALRRGYISKYQLTLLLTRQKAIQPQFGKYFVEHGMISSFQISRIIEEMKAHNRKFWAY